MVLQPTTLPCAPFHIYNIRNLKIPRVLATVMKSVLYLILFVLWFHCILLRLNVYFHTLGNENAKAKCNLCKRVKRWYCIWGNEEGIEMVRRLYSHNTEDHGLEKDIDSPSIELVIRSIWSECICFIHLYCSWNSECSSFFTFVGTEHMYSTFYTPGSWWWCGRGLKGLSCEWVWKYCSRYVCHHSLLYRVRKYRHI
jgi:hypothetical protein